MKVVDIREARQGVTPKSVLENALEHVDEIADAVVVFRTKEGQILHGNSTTNHLNVLGLLETGKTLVLNDMWEEI